MTSHRDPLKGILTAFREKSQEMGNTVEPLRQQAAAIGGTIRALVRQLEPVAEGVRRVQEQAAPLAEALKETQERIETAFEPFNGHVRSLARLVEENQEVIQQFVKWIQEAPLDVRSRQEALEKIAEFGWYCDPEMPLFAPTELSKALDEQDTEKVLGALDSYFQNRTDAIETTVSAAFPNRQPIFQDAFEAHRAKKYNLSIPVLLAQADGMWGERFSRGVFMVDGRVSGVATCIQQSQSDFFEPLIRLFDEPLPLWRSEKQRGSSFSELNRHQVLHGEVVDYGTERNSLKVISFLSFLCWVLDSSSASSP